MIVVIKRLIIGNNDSKIPILNGSKVSEKSFLLGFWCSRTVESLETHLQIYKTFTFLFSFNKESRLMCQYWFCGFRAFLYAKLYIKNLKISKLSKLS